MIKEITLTQKQSELIAALLTVQSSFDEKYCIPIGEYKETADELQKIFGAYYKKWKPSRVILFERDDYGTLYDPEKEEYRHITEFTLDQIRDPEMLMQFPDETLKSLMKAYKSCK